MIRFFAERHLLVNLLSLTVVVLAFFLSPKVAREYLPAVEMPRVTITAQLPGASAQDMETKVTIPIEEVIAEIDGVDEYYTTIADSVSSTTVELYIDSTEAQVQTAMQDLRDAVDGITDFPPDMEEAPILKRLNPGKYPVVEVALAGPMHTIIPFAKDLERRIERLDGVSLVTIVGLQDPELRVLVDPVLAQTHGVALMDVVSAIERRNVSATGGVLESSSTRAQVVVWSRFDEPEQVRETVVAARQDSGILKLRDIARVELTREDTGLISHTNAEPGLSLVIRKREDGDAIKAVDAVRAVLEGIELPAGVTYEFVDDETFYTRNRLGVMFSNGLMGIILVTTILMAFMRFDAAIWVLIGIPIVFCSALVWLLPLGLTFNLFTLTGFVIVLGMVVDDAVVVAENIVAHRERGLAPARAAVLGAQEMVRPVVASAVTTALAFGPIVAMGGIPGKVLWQIPAMVVLVLIFSLLETFFILPSHMSSLKSSKSSPGKRAWLSSVETLYRNALRCCLHRRLTVIVLAFGVLVLVLAVVRPLVDFEQFPQTDARTLFVKLSTPLGTSLEQTEAIATDLQHQIQRITKNDLRAITARVGHQDIHGNEKTRGEAEHEALLTVFFKELDRQHTNQEWIDVLGDELEVRGDVDLKLQSEYMGPPTDQPITVHVLANDASTRRAVAREIAEYIRGVEGTTQIEIDERPGMPKLDLNLDYDKLAGAGLDVASVALAVQASFFGLEASEHRGVEEVTALRVQFDPSARGDLDALLDTPVRNDEGQLVSLSDVVNPVVTPGLDRIYHREGFRAATVRASFISGSPHTALKFAKRMESEILPRYEGKGDLEVLIGGEAADTVEATRNLASVALLVVLAIGLVVWLVLGSLLEALSALIAIPFAVAGVILAFFVHDIQLSMTAMIGTIGLAGVVVNASIVMIDSIHRFQEQDKGVRLPSEVIEDAVVSRLRPVLITTLTTLGGVLPTAYGLGGYDTIVSPMSVAIGWGLMFSTLVTLFLIPVLYSTVRDTEALLSRVGLRARSVIFRQVAALRLRT